jgi:hypothetical protein
MEPFLAVDRLTNHLATSHPLSSTTSIFWYGEMGTVQRLLSY